MALPRRKAPTANWRVKYRIRARYRHPHLPRADVTQIAGTSYLARLTDPALLANLRGIARALLSTY